MLATAIITPPRITFRIFIGQHRALRFKHGARDDIFRRNQLNLVFCRPVSRPITSAMAGSRLASDRRKPTASESVNLVDSDIAVPFQTMDGSINAWQRVLPICPVSSTKPKPNQPSRRRISPQVMLCPEIPLNQNFFQQGQSSVIMPSTPNPKSVHFRFVVYRPNMNCRPSRGHGQCCAA